jgi:hypothetical protein
VLLPTLKKTKRNPGFMNADALNFLLKILTLAIWYGVDPNTTCYDNTTSLVMYSIVDGTPGLFTEKKATGAE